MAKSKKAKDADEVKNYIMKLSTSDIEFCLVSPMVDEIGRRPPYMYTSLCPDPRFRAPAKVVEE